MRHILIVLILSLIGGSSLAQETKDENRWLQNSNPAKSKGVPIISSWHTGTAGIIKSDGAELSLFNPSRIGMTQNTELLIRIGEELILPNIGLKHRWWTNDRFTLSTEHTLYYTWPGLKIIQSQHIKDLIPDSIQLNQGIAMRHELLFSWLINPRIFGCPNPAAEKILTLRAGTEFYAGFGESDIQPFDWFHSLYHTQILDHKILYYGGLQFDSYFFNRFHYSINALYYNVDFTSHYALEGNLRLTYYLSRRIGLSASCKVSGTKIAMPVSTQDPDTKNKIQLSVLPLLDITLLIHPDRGQIRHGLFKNNRKRR